MDSRLLRTGGGVCIYSLLTQVLEVWGGEGGGGLWVISETLFGSFIWI